MGVVIVRVKPLITVTTEQLQWLLRTKGTATIGARADGVDYLISKQDDIDDEED